MVNIFDKDTLKLLRFPFSFFLMPVYFLALSQSEMVDDQNTVNAFLVFIVLHVFIYPASNGYNCYMDRDEGSIGGLRNPPKATKNVFYASLLFDMIGFYLAMYINIQHCVGVLAYIAVSRAYSYRGIRIKKYPFLGFFSVILFQGAVTFINVYIGVNDASTSDIYGSGLIYPMLASTTMIAGIYPLTQIYQHEQDKANGDTTLSYVLGYRGTFLFSFVMFAITAALLYIYLSPLDFQIFTFFMLPVGAYFTWWFVRVVQNPASANFDNTMHMTLISSVCMNACFLTMFILDKLS